MLRNADFHANKLHFYCFGKSLLYVRCFLFTKVHKIYVEQKFKIHWKETSYFYKYEIARVLLSNQCNTFS